jgi:hypothetical protein
MIGHPDLPVTLRQAKKRPYSGIRSVELTRPSFDHIGVSDGIRTHDIQDHNLAL